MPNPLQRRKYSLRNLTLKGQKPRCENCKHLSMRYITGILASIEAALLTQGNENGAKSAEYSHREA